MLEFENQSQHLFFKTTRSLEEVMEEHILCQRPKWPSQKVELSSFIHWQSVFETFPWGHAKTRLFSRPWILVFTKLKSFFISLLHIYRSIHLFWMGDKNVGRTSQKKCACVCYFVFQTPSMKTGQKKRVPIFSLFFLSHLDMRSTFISLLIGTTLVALTSAIKFDIRGAPHDDPFLTRRCFSQYVPKDTKVLVTAHIGEGYNQRIDCSVRKTEKKTACLPVLILPLG